MWLRAAHGTRCSNSTASLGTLLRHVLFCTSTAMCCSPQPSLLIPPGSCCYYQTSWAALGFSCSPVPDPRGSMVLPGPAALEYQGPGPSQAPIFSSRSPTEDPSQAPEDSPSETRTRGDTNRSPLPAETLGFCFPPPSTHPRATRAGGLLRHVLVQIWGGDVNICDAHACKDFLGTVAWEMCICRTQHRAGGAFVPGHARAQCGRGHQAQEPAKSSPTGKGMSSAGRRARCSPPQTWWLVFCSVEIPQLAPRLVHVGLGHLCGSEDSGGSLPLPSRPRWAGGCTASPQPQH